MLITIQTKPLQLYEITRFTAIDFETGTHQATSICQMDIVEFINNEPFYELNLLVLPPNNKSY